MHKIHITEGMVLSKHGIGEANAVVALLTDELGLVKASVRSARREHSKLRYGLEAFTKARFSLVRGKHEWRLVGVEKVSKELISLSALRRASVGRVTKLLLRLVAGEEPTPKLFDDVAEGFALLANPTHASHLPDAVEVVLVLRILSRLGYLPRTEALAPFVEDEFSMELSAKALASRSLLIKTINESLAETGL